MRNTSVSITNKKRLIIAFVILCILILALCIKVGYVQIVQGDSYKKKAVAQQTKDEVVKARRGDITDRSGEELAVSTIKYAVWVRPSEVRQYKSDDKNEAAVRQTAEKLAQILDLDSAELEKKIRSGSGSLKIAKDQDLDVAEKIRKAGLTGVTTTEETRRYYPLGNFASQLLGNVTDDNNGLAGLELYYNHQLKGVSGRWIRKKDVSGNSLLNGNEEYYAAKNGAALQLTIDEVIQEYAEEAIAKTRKSVHAKRVSCLVMNPETGEVLAMASTPGYDPNNAREPRAADKERFSRMSSGKQLDYLNEIWRNPMICDTYEPGSTFKLLTTAMALEENKVSDDEYFECGGGLNVNGTFIKCWINPGSHGTETLKQAVGNSCNPVFMRLAQRVGKKKFYEYLDTFGITSTTGIDYPGEASAQIQDQKDVGRIELSTMGFGQGIAVTPIQLMTAINSFANDGMMVQPHLVKKMRGSDGRTKTIKTKKIRQTVSEETADKILEYMEYVVEKGGGKKAKIKGWRIGGKTGTAEKKTEGSSTYDARIASFAGVAPVDDPKISILYIIDEPAGEVFGGDVAAPGAKSVLQKTLQYMQVKETDQ
ncbi:MAG: peptidoglycan D,D-transpeptidase FtsI family protein [Anaerovoracaceae bacterium]